MLRNQDGPARLQERSDSHACGRSPSGLRLLAAGLLVALLAACGGGGGGASSTSTTASTVPGMPTAMTVTAGDGKTTVSWGAVTGASSYNVYSQTPGGAEDTT